MLSFVASFFPSIQSVHPIMPWVTEDEPRLLPHRSLKIWQLHSRPLLDKHPFGGKISLVSAAADTLVQGWCFFPIPHVIKLFHDRVEDQPCTIPPLELKTTYVLRTKFSILDEVTPFVAPCPPQGTGTITLAPTFGSFTLLEPVSLVKLFTLFILEWILLVFRVWTE